MTGSALRAVETEAEIAAWAELHNRILPLRAESPVDVRSYRAALEERIHLLAPGAGVAFAAREEAEALVADALVAVLPEARGVGLGCALAAGLSAWAGERNLAEFQGFVEEEDRPSLAWAGRRGFVEAGRESRLVLDLGSLDPPEPAPPDGIAVTSLAARPELVRGVYEVACEAYPDIPGREESRMQPFEEWLAHDLSGAGDRPEAVFLALAGEEVVGYSKFHLTDARPDVALHDVTGVKRAWRGRGIAGALKRAQIAWALAAGYRRLETMNEVRNAPIRRLNERFGYSLAPGRVLVRGPLFHSGANALQSD